MLHTKIDKLMEIDGLKVVLPRIIGGIRIITVMRIHRRN